MFGVPKGAPLPRILRSAALVHPCTSSNRRASAKPWKTSNTEKPARGGPFCIWRPQESYSGHPALHPFGAVAAMRRRSDLLQANRSNPAGSHLPVADGQTKIPA